MFDMCEQDRRPPGTEHDEVSLHPLREPEDSLSGVTVHDDTFRIAPIIGRFRDHLFERALERVLGEFLPCNGWLLWAYYVAEK